MGLSTATTPTEPLGELNTTPLIDVMLVLLVMFIISIPVATHSIDVDLPQCGAKCDRLPLQDTVKNKVIVTADDQLLWNGIPVSDGQFGALLNNTIAMPEEPELQFEPDALASYQQTARLLRQIHTAGVTKFGFVGNERYRTFGTDG